MRKALLSNNGSLVGLSRCEHLFDQGSTFLFRYDSRRNRNHSSFPCDVHDAPDIWLRGARYIWFGLFHVFLPSWQYKNYLLVTISNHTIKAITNSYLSNVLVPKVSKCPDLLNPMYGLVLSSRSGPPVTYQSIQIIQKSTKIFIKAVMYYLVYNKIISDTLNSNARYVH